MYVFFLTNVAESITLEDITINVKIHISNGQIKE